MDGRDENSRLQAIAEKEEVVVEADRKTRRRRERIVGLVLALFLGGLFYVEFELLRVSSRLPFVNSVFFFGLMNLNVVLILALLFLVFRNVMKAIVEDRGGRPGNRLKTQLVFSFILFAIVPTVLMFTISATYIRASFDKWFGLRVGDTLRQSVDIGNQFYENAKRNGSHFARRIGAELADSNAVPDAARLETLRLTYAVDGVEWYAHPLAPRVFAANRARAASIPSAPLETLEKAFTGQGECRVLNVGAGDLVRCPARLGEGRGAIFTTTFVPVRLAESLAEIAMTFRDYDKDNPLSNPIKSTYFAILLMVTLLILFAAAWTGFHLAKRLTGPLEALLRGTEAVTLGDLAFRIVPRGSWEVHRLIASFNLMTGQLEQQKRDIEGTWSELERRNRYIETLLGSVQSGVISLDENGRIGMVNPAAAKLLQVAAEDLVGMPYWAIVPEGHRGEARQLLASATAAPSRRELRFRTNSGEWVSILATVSPLRDASGRAPGVVAVFDDVTDIRKMERLSAWQEVARRLAHEIKNPLTPIQLSVQRLQRKYSAQLGNDEAFHQATNIILKEVDALKTLVNEFSSFARLPLVRPQPEDLNDVLLEAVALFRSAHERVVFQLSLAEGLPQLALDRSGMKRVLVNLFDNAVAAMAAAGTIEVRTELDEAASLVRLTVADEGAGLSEAVQDRLFEPYFSTKESGTGLGLAIVQRILADHGATVRAVENQPRGTRFELEFPLRLEEVASSSLGPPRPEA